MKLNKISLKDQGVFLKYLSLKKHDLSVYAFENIYIWKGLFDIYWEVFDDSLCVFFKDKIGCFLYLSPLTKELKVKVIEKAFGVMSSMNSNEQVSRIENIEEQELDDYRRFGYRITQKFCEYICSRERLANLSGVAYKHKRASANYFMKNYAYEYLPFSRADAKPCLALYVLWSSQRKENYKDKIYQGMIGDSLKSLKILFESYKKLNCIGRIVKIDNRIKGFTFGFKLNQDTFCVLYEITDLSVKGLAQFIFSEFSRELERYKYINIMDDSGLDNLKKAKLSYKPVRLVSSYIVQ